MTIPLDDQGKRDAAWAAKDAKAVSPKIDTPPGEKPKRKGTNNGKPPKGWPWAAEFWKPRDTVSTLDERIEAADWAKKQALTLEAYATELQQITDDDPWPPVPPILDALGYIDMTVNANADNSEDVVWSNAEVLALLRELRAKLAP